MATAARQIGTHAVDEQVLELVREVLTELGSHQAARVATLHSSFERDLGLGSLERVELLVRAESRFKIQLPDEIAQKAETPAEWVQALCDGQAAKAPKQRYQIVQPSREANPAPESAKSLVDILRHHAEIDPSRVHIHLPEDDGGEDITYGQLLERASRVAASLRAGGLRRKETVAIMLPTCADFFYAFYGVILAGGIAVPIYPPARPDKIEEYVHRQVLILRNAGVRFLISFEQARVVSEVMRLNIPSLLAVTSVEELSGGGARLPSAGVIPADTAFIQYTSGSTGDPKGVVLSHANILANVRGIGWAVKFRPSDIVVSWLPLYHDMGLIGSWLFSVYFGAPITVLSPLAFLSRPERWLWALHDSHGTLCPAPNFSYEMCARKISDRALQGLDLSAWRIAINAGEAVLPDTLERFARRFEPYGFRREAFVPCYGLAESSVALAFPPIDRRPVIDTIRRDVFEREGRAIAGEPGQSLAVSKVLRYVANGRAMPQHEIKLVDGDGREVPERTTGRVLFRGLSKTSGYFRNPEATEAVTTEDGWMDSGDLGYLAEGELYITGRVKELIIKGGHNITPQEVEAAAAETAGVRKGCVAAFGVVDPETGTERFVVAAETRATASDELARIEAGIIHNVGLIVGTPPDKVVLLPPQSIPKTSSGKIRRNETRSLYERNELAAGKRPPWLQIVRLWLRNADAWAAARLRRSVASLRGRGNSAAFAATAAMGGMLVRLVPSGNTAWRVIRPWAQLGLRLSGEHWTARNGEQSPAKPAVLMASRTGPLDPLVLAAGWPQRFVFSDLAALAGLPRSAAFLLRPLVAPPIKGQINGQVHAPNAPGGGELQQVIRRALEDGCSVLVFPESAPGAAAHRSRFRLDAIRAAAETSSPIYPVAVRGKSLHAVGSVGDDRDEESDGDGLAGRQQTEVCVGEPVRPRAGDDHAAIRQQVRERIVRLCDEA
ncbi:MAG TPA: AMP-binding protein [Terriglobia bacterium]|nr:AMP-binding protein [Terriglobia bacterium]